MHGVANMVQWMGSYVGIRLYPCIYIILCFYVFINKDMPICFISGEILLEAVQLQHWWISLSIHSTVPVHHMCSVANQVRTHDVNHWCVMYVHWQSCTCHNCIQQCMCTPIFQVLHMVNMQTRACTDTHMWLGLQKQGISAQNTHVQKIVLILVCA